MPFEIPSNGILSLRQKWQTNIFIHRPPSRCNAHDFNFVFSLPPCSDADAVAAAPNKIFMLMLFYVSLARAVHGYLQFTPNANVSTFSTFIRHDMPLDMVAVPFREA